jgi:hypothetical protein
LVTFLSFSQTPVPVLSLTDLYFVTLLFLSEERNYQDWVTVLFIRQ